MEIANSNNLGEDDFMKTMLAQKMTLKEFKSEFRSCPRARDIMEHVVRLYGNVHPFPRHAIIPRHDDAYGNSWFSSLVELGYITEYNKVLDSVNPQWPELVKAYFQKFPRQAQCFVSNVTGE